MTKKIVEVDYEDGLHLADAADDPGCKRALLYDDDGKLRAHAKLREIDEGELRERYAEHDYYDYDDDDYYYEDVELTPEQREFAQMAGEALAAMIIALVSAAAPHVRHWWDEAAVPGIKGFFGGVADFFTGVGRKGHAAKKQEKKEAVSSVNLAVGSLRIDPKDIRSEIDVAYERYREDMDREEAQRVLLEIVVLSSMLAARIKRLSNARISDASIPGGYLGWQETVKMLSSQKLIDGVNRILTGEVQFLDEAQVVSLEMVLGRKLFEKGQYIPINADELRKRLMPDLVDSGDDNEGDDSLALA